MGYRLPPSSFSLLYLPASQCVFAPRIPTAAGIVLKRPSAATRLPARVSNEATYSGKVTAEAARLVGPPLLEVWKARTAMPKSSKFDRKSLSSWHMSRAMTYLNTRQVLGQLQSLEILKRSCGANPHDERQIMRGYWNTKSGSKVCYRETRLGGILH